MQAHICNGLYGVWIGWVQVYYAALWCCVCFLLQKKVLFSELFANSVTMKPPSLDMTQRQNHGLEFSKSMSVWLIAILSQKSVCPKSCYNPEITAPKISVNMVVKINIPITGSNTAPFFKFGSTILSYPEPVDSNYHPQNIFPSLIHIEWTLYGDCPMHFSPYQFASLKEPFRS